MMFILFSYPTLKSPLITDWPTPPIPTDPTRPASTGSKSEENNLVDGSINFPDRSVSLRKTLKPRSFLQTTIECFSCTISKESPYPIYSERASNTAKHASLFKTMDAEKASLENEEKRFDLELDLDLDMLSDNIAGDIST